MKKKNTLPFKTANETRYLFNETVECRTILFITNTIGRL